MKSTLYYGDNLDILQIIDKKNDRYRKKIVNEATGKIAVDKNIKLSEKNNP